MERMGRLWGVVFAVIFVVGRISVGDREIIVLDPFVGKPPLAGFECVLEIRSSLRFGRQHLRQTMINRN